MKKLAVLLLAALLLLSLGGCSLWAMEEKLDNMEDAVENRVDAMEDAAEAAITQALTPNETAPVVQIAPESVPMGSSPATITREEAESIALNYVNLTADQVTALRTEFEIDDGIQQYDVQFFYDRMEYEFEINAQTGDIISFDRDD